MQKDEYACGGDRCLILYWCLVTRGRVEILATVLWCGRAWCWDLKICFNLWSGWWLIQSLARPESSGSSDDAKDITWEHFILIWERWSLVMSQVKMSRTFGVFSRETYILYLVYCCLSNMSRMLVVFVVMDPARRRSE